MDIGIMGFAVHARLISKKLGKLMLLLLRKIKNYVQPHQHQTAVAQNRTVARFLAIQPV